MIKSKGQYSTQYQSSSSNLQGLCNQQRKNASGIRGNVSTVEFTGETSIILTFSRLSFKTRVSGLYAQGVY